MLSVENYNGDALVFELYDVYGRKVKNRSVTSKETRIEKGNLAPGIYFWKLAGENAIVATGQLIAE